MTITKEIEVNETVETEICTTVETEIELRDFLEEKELYSNREAPYTISLLLEVIHEFDLYQDFCNLMTDEHAKELNYWMDFYNKGTK